MPESTNLEKTTTPATPVSPSATATPTPTPAPTSQAPIPAKEQPASDDDSKHTPTPDVSATNAPTPKPPADTEAQADTKANSSGKGPTGSGAPVDTTATALKKTSTSLDEAPQTVTFAAAAAAPADASPAPPARLGPVASLVSSFLSLVAAPFFAGGTNAPGGPVASVVEFLYVASRRIQQFFSFSVPTAAPVQISQIANGTVTGLVGGLEPGGNSLQYTVTRGPTNGTVVLDTTGNYTYTPNAVLAVTGGTDTFDVTVSDTNFSLGDIIRTVFGQPTSAKTTVTVNVARPGAATTIDVGSSPQGVALSADGTRAYVTNSADGSVSVIDAASGQVIRTIQGVGNTPVGIVASGGKLYVANQNDGSVAVIDTATDQVTTIGVGQNPQSLTLAAGKLYVVNAKDGTVSVIDTASGLVTATVGVGQTPAGIAASPDGTRVYVTNSAGVQGGTISVIDTATNTVKTIAVGSTPTGIAVSPDGTKVYFTDFDRHVVSVIDAATNTIQSNISVGAFPDAIVVSPDGSKLYVTSTASGTVTVVDTATNRAFGTISLGATLPALALSADGTKLYAANLDTNTLSVVAVNAAAAPPLGTPRAPSTAPSDATRYNPFQNYTVQNLTDHEVRFLGYGVIDGPNTQPDNGPGQNGQPTVIPPGGTFTFQLGRETGRVEAYLGYGDNPSDPEYARYSLTFYHGSGFYVRDETRCEGSGGAGNCSGISTFNAILLPTPGTTLKITDKREQSLILNMLCRDRSNCSFQQTAFTPQGEPVSLPRKIIGKTQTNGTNGPAIYRFSESTTQYHTISLSVTAKVSAQIDDLVSGSFSATYGQSWTTGVIYQESTSFNIDPQDTGWLTLSVPANQITGTIYAEYNNVQYELSGIEFYQPVADPGLENWTSVTCSHPPTRGSAGCT